MSSNFPLNIIFPTFVDQLLAKIRALPACAAPVVVFDGTEGAARPDLFVAVGGSVEPTGDATEEWAELGAKAMWESIDVNCRIWSWVGGDDNAGQGSNNDAGSDAQKTARDAAFNVLWAIDTALRADTNFLTQNGGTPLVQWCNISKWSADQTPASDSGAKGRSCLIKFTVYVRARKTTV